MAKNIDRRLETTRIGVDVLVKSYTSSSSEYKCKTTREHTTLHLFLHKNAPAARTPRRRACSYRARPTRRRWGGTCARGPGWRGREEGGYCWEKKRVSGVLREGGGGEGKEGTRKSGAPTSRTRGEGGGIAESRTSKTPASTPRSTGLAGQRRKHTTRLFKPLRLTTRKPMPGYLSIGSSCVAHERAVFCCVIL
ncbi:hypothetical protein C8R44DRAFT_747188 [Mycena epipterygia]|nr:hypothetical protein C8R44DRAFT_747188 [Mycena epipterygia]